MFTLLLGQFVTSRCAGNVYGCEFVRSAVPNNHFKPSALKSHNHRLFFIPLAWLIAWEPVSLKEQFLIIDNL